VEKLEMQMSDSDGERGEGDPELGEGMVAVKRAGMALARRFWDGVEGEEKRKGEEGRCRKMDL
jgi:hypothetical protein